MASLRQLSRSSSRDSSFPSPAEQAERILPMLQKKLKEGDEWNVVASEWWKQWLAYTNSATGETTDDVAGDTKSGESKDLSSRPPKIDNSSLLGETARELRKNAVLDFDFVLVPAEAWTLLFEWYEGGPAFTRSVISQGERKELIVELHPYRFRVVRADADGSPKEVDESDKSDPLKGDYQILYFSKTATVDHVMQTICASFATLKIDSRLWFSSSLSAEDWTLVTTGDSMSQLTLGGDNGCLLLETKGQSTGTFPRDVAVVSSTWREELKVGDWLDVQDRENKWYEARILERNGNMIKVHFHAWSSKFDEVLDLEKQRKRLQPMNTKVKAWRDFRVNDNIEYNKMAKGVGRPAWVHAVIEQVDKVKRELTIHPKNKRSNKIKLSFDSELITWYGCFTTSRYRRRPVGGDELGNPTDGAGVVGLVNLGNTCFMNSMLQCLSNCEPLTNHFLSDSFRSDINTTNPLGMGGRLAETYANLLTRMWSGEIRTARPKDIKMLIGQRAPNFQGYQQQDSQEFMSYLLDGLHEDLNRVIDKESTEAVESNGRPDQVVAAESWARFGKRNSSFVVDTFFGMLRSEVRCDDPDCDRVSITFDPVSSIPLPLPEVRNTSFLVYLTPADPSSPRMRYCVTVPKSAQAGAVKKWLLEARPDLAADDLVLAQVRRGQITSIYKDTQQVQHKYDECHAYQIRRLASTSAAEGKNEVDENGLCTYMRVRCQHKRVGGRQYNAWIMGRNEDGTYEILYSDSDQESKVASERIFKTDWDMFVRTPQEILTQIAGPGRSRAIFPVYHRKADIGRISTNSPTYQMYESPMLLTLQAPFTGRAIYDLVWQHIERFVDAAGSSEWSRQNLPYQIMISNLDCRKTKAVPDNEQVMDSIFMHTNEAVLLLHWSAEALGRGAFDTTAYKNTLDHSSVPVRGGAGGAGKVGGLSLTSCIEQLCQKERLGQMDTWYCRKCNKEGREGHRRAFKKFNIYSTGEVLVLQLKRFSIDSSSMSSRFGGYSPWVSRNKNTQLVDFPIEGLDLSDFVMDKSGPPPIYDLFAVSNHSGGLGGGHYTAYGKNFLTNEWYLFNDSSTRRVDASEVVSAQAYVLFYRRRPVAAGAESKE